MTNKKLFGSLLVLAALSGATSVAAADIQCLTPIDVTGTEAKIRVHDYSSIVWLKNAPLSDLTVGYGPGSDPKAEISIIDGQYHVARPEGAEIRVDLNPADQGAAMLVRATPAAWADAGTLKDLFDLASLNAALSARIKEMGCDGDATLPFRITAHADEVKWSVDGEPEKALGTIADADVIIVGVYSNHDKANTFMSPGFSLHAHVHVPATGFAGHVVEATLADGAVLQLSAAN
ncbi:MAG: hypothetical protein ACK414_05760 [Gemmobacter sp.]